MSWTLFSPFLLSWRFPLTVGIRNQFIAPICLGCATFESFCYYLSTPHQIYLTLGNNRPQILVKLEDLVLQAILNICEGQSTQRIVVSLSHDIELFQTDLASNNEAVNWFNLSRPAVSPPLTTPVGPTPLPGQSIDHTQHDSCIDFLNDRRPCLPSAILLQLSFCAYSITFHIEYEYFVA